MGDFWIFFIMAVMVLCVGWGAFRIVCQGKWAFYLAFLAVLALLAAYFGIRARQEQGWDSIGYFAFLMVFIMPTLAGFVLGGIAGFVKRRRGA
ncbi:hypothetical protein PGB28_03490 [Primorskyibacter aestuariivivens]|uniref:hypothetical protein n=1 Tax=Primorskyibacter aestuariivivens TaxID=1888912 RepID=UPI002301D5D4|nr:hypothetical protein [Primorskyibacter aestuariivivens]MDA7427509.1 hypothetical protein [Primorskyibacter aestuariivivens]